MVFLIDISIAHNVRGLSYIDTLLLDHRHFIQFKHINIGKYGPVAKKSDLVSVPPRC